MRKAFLLCCLVALGAANQHYGAWRMNTEYQYKVNTKSLAAIPNLQNQWVGLYTKADLTIRPVSEDVLVGKIQNGEYSEWHDSLPNGPVNYQPDDQLSYQPMQMSKKLFEIRLNKGAIHSIAVDKKMTNVELNQLKSIISQLQVDIQGRNAINSQHNHLPRNDHDEDSNHQALYKVMEPTVTGKYETLYDISRVPLYVAQSSNEYDSSMQLDADEHVYEVFKTKNYSNSEQPMGYHFGISGLNDWKPNTNTMGSLSKSAISRVIITGSIEKYTIRSSHTTNRIVKADSDKNAQHDSVVVSQVNLTLAAMEHSNSQPQVDSDSLIDVGNLVYSYDLPSDEKNTLRPKKDSSESDEEDEEEQNYDANTINRIQHAEDLANENERHHQKKYKNQSRSPRSILDNYNHRNRDEHEDSLEHELMENEYAYKGKSKKEHYQPKPTLKDAPENPLHNYFIGNKGRSIQNWEDFNAPNEVHELSKEIAKDLENPNEMTSKHTLRKYSILATIISTMDAEQIEETTRLYTQNGNEMEERSRQVYRDALVSAGTGPAVNELMQWIEERKMQGEEAAQVIAAFPKAIREPTKEMQQRFFDFLQNDAVRHQNNVNTTAGIAYTHYMYQAHVNKKSPSKYYPVESYRLNDSDRDDEFVSKRVVPYFADILKKAVEEQDVPKVLYAIRALGNLGYSSIPRVFEPYLEGEVTVSDFQRLAIVLAMDKYVENYPKMAQVVLFKIYQNKGETNEIRSAAVFYLMRTNPSATLLQRLAEETNNEESGDVRAAVRSAIESAAHLTNPEHQQLAQNARSTLYLLKVENQAVQYSRTRLRDYVVREMDASYEQQASYTVNKDSFLPNGIYLETTYSSGGFRGRSEYQAVISSIEQLINIFSDNSESNHNDYNNDESSQGETAHGQPQWTLKKIINLLNLKPNEAKQMEAQFLVDIMNSDRFFAINERTLKQLPTHIKQFTDKLNQGVDLRYTKWYNKKDVTVSFPLETGIPFTFTYRTPTLVYVNGKVTGKTHPSVVNDAQDKIRMPESIHMNGDLEVVYSVLNEVTVSFINPSTSQRYTAGYDKKAQFHVPIHFSSEVDIRNREFRTEFKPLNMDKSTKIVEMGSWPFTARDHVFSRRPLPESEHTKDLRSRPVRETKYKFGEKEIGFAFTVKGTQQKDSSQLANLWTELRKHDLTSTYFFGQENMSPEHYSFSVIFDPKESYSHSTKVTAKYAYSKPAAENQPQSSSRVHPRSRGQTADGTENLAIPETTTPNSHKRQQEFLRKAAEGVNAPNGAYVLDMSMEFHGEKQPRQYIATVAGAASSTEGKARALVYVQRPDSYVKSQTKTYHLQMDADYQNVEEQNEENSSPKANIEFVWTHTLDKELELNTIRGKVEMEQSPELRRMHSEESSNQELDHGNRHGLKNTIDIIKVVMHSDNALVDEETKQTLAFAYNYIRFRTLMYLNENLKYQGQDKQAELEVRLSPDMSSANVTLKTENMKSEWYGVPVPEMTKKYITIVPTHWNYWEHAVRNAVHNRNTCYIKGNRVTTFENNNVTYDRLGATWHLAVHKMRDSADWRNDNSNVNRNHYVSVLVRDASQPDQYDADYSDNESPVSPRKNINKEVMIVLHQKNNNDINLHLSQSHEESNNAPKLDVNGNRMELNTNEPYVLRSTENPSEVLARVYAIQHNTKNEQRRSLKVETELGQLEVHYNGKKLQIRSKSYNRNNRGICGAYTGQKANDLKSPQNSIIYNENDFVASWALVDSNSAPSYLKKSQQHIKDTQYPMEKTLYGNPIHGGIRSSKSTSEQGERNSNSENYGDYRGQEMHRSSKKSNLKYATKHQTQFVEDKKHSRICFSKRALPVCAPGYRANGKAVQTVEVVCRHESDPAAQQYKLQIQNGRSLNLTRYNSNGKMQFTVPKRCEQA